MHSTGAPSAADQARLAQLMEIHQRQTQAFAAMMEANQYNATGNLVAADQAFARNIALSKEAIGLAMIYNQSWPNSIEIAPIAQVAVNSLFVQADGAESRGDLTRAELLRKEALELSKTYLGSTANAESERSRASSLMMQGRFNEALVALASARDQFQASGEIIKVVRTTIDMVDILQWLNDYQRAAAELSRAAAASKPLLQNMSSQSAHLPVTVEDFQRIAVATELARIQVELDYYQGLIQGYLGNYEKAEQSFRTVFPVYQAQGVGEAIEFQLANNLSKKGEYQAAWSLLERLTPKFFSDARFRPKLAALLKVQAQILYKTGRPNDALTLADKAIADLSTYKDPDQLWRCWALKSELLAALHRQDEALNSYKRTAAVINSLRAHPLGYRLDSTFLQDKLPVLEAAIDLCCAGGRGRECAEFVEMLKSRALLAVLSARSSDPAGASVVEKQFEESTRKLDAIEYQQFQNGATPESENQKQALLAERSQLLERLRYSDPRWRSLSEAPATDLDRVSRVLAERNQAALSLYYRQGKIIAVLLQGGDFTAEAMNVSPQTIESLQENVANLHSTTPDYTRYDLSASMGLGAKHLVPATLLEKALTSSQLLIVPHGPLHLIPWAGLIFNGQRLFQYCPVGILPNLGCIAALNAPFSSEPHLAAIGAPDYAGLRLLPPLPSAAQEIEKLTALYANQTLGVAFTGKLATAANFWKLLKHQDGSGILHVACHATYEPLEPMRSGLLLADAKVDAAEIARTRISFDEVVLSACSTGYRPTEVEGVVLAGDDILGLPAAFLEAGAAAVLVSIPTADDQASAALIVQYHQARHEGKTPLVALQHAQLAMLEGQFEPFQWVGFTAYATQ